MNQQQAALIVRLCMSDSDIAVLYPEADQKWYSLIREWGARGGDIETKDIGFPRGWRNNPEPLFHTRRDYRLAPRTVTLSGPGGTFELPEPMRVAPIVGATVFMADPLRESGVLESLWGDSEAQRRCLARGLCHATQEAAQQWADALSKVMGVQS